jgi:isobutyryl-CoA mutase
VPGEFPYAAGVFPFKRAEEDPARMFAGEGPPEQTNAPVPLPVVGDGRQTPLHRLRLGHPVRGGPHERPDIYGKVGNSGVSIATLDDAKKLYSGFDLSDPATSVSMTINGPAPMILAFFMNAAIDQACETYITEQDCGKKSRPGSDALLGERTPARVSRWSA